MRNLKLRNSFYAITLILGLSGCAPFQAQNLTSDSSSQSPLNSTSAPPTRDAFYVSPSGDDSLSGRSSSLNGTDGPFRTLAKAQAALRLSNIKTVYIRGGTYALSAPLALTVDDNAEAWVGYPGEQAVLDAAGGDAFDLTRAVGVQIENLTIRNVKVGVYINDHSSGTVVRFNSFFNCALNCVSSNYFSSSSTVDSNSFDGGGTGVGDPYQRPLGTCHAAIYFNFNTNNNVISHNLIQNFHSAGISLAGGSTEVNNNNSIDHNILRNTNMTLNDSGAIYILDRSHQSVGNRITSNSIDGNGTTTQSTKCIYLDDQTSNVTVTGNIGRNCGQYGIQYHGGDHNVVTGNIFDLSNGAKLGLYQDDLDPGLSLPNYGMSGNTFKQNIVYFAGAAPNTLWDYDNNYGGSNVAIAPLDLTNNLYFSANGSSVPNSGSVTDTQPKFGNPGFANAAGGDYTLAANSAAPGQIGFAALGTGLGPRSLPAALP